MNGDYPCSHAGCTHAAPTRDETYAYAYDNVWEYRLVPVRVEVDGEEVVEVGLYEVYFEADVPVSRSEEPVELRGHTAEDIRFIAESAREAYEAGVLEFDPADVPAVLAACGCDDAVITQASTVMLGIEDGALVVSYDPGAELVVLTTESMHAIVGALNALKADRDTARAMLDLRAAVAGDVRW